MQRKLLKQPTILINIILASGIGILLGIISISLAPSLMLIGIAGIIYVVIAWILPEFALLILLLLTSTIIDIYSFPSIPIGIGHFIVTDVILLVLIGIILLRGVVESNSRFIQTPLDLPLLSFYFIAILSTAVAIYQGSLTFNQSLGELRLATFYLTFFITTNLIRDKKHLRRLLNGIFVLVAFVALFMIAQYILGDATKFLPGYVATLTTAGTSDPGVTRVLPPGQSLVLMGLITMVVLVIVDKKRRNLILDLTLVSITGLAVLFTFNRNFWVAVGLSLMLVIYWVSMREKERFAKITFWAIITGAIVLLLVIAVAGNYATNLINGSVTRFSTLFSVKTLNEDSLQYRYVEINYALPQIASHPILGIGLGGDYRPWDPQIDPVRTVYDKRAYIHSGHLYVILKTGMIGYLCLMWFLILFMRRGIQKWRLISDPFLRGIVLSFTTIVISISIAAIVSPVYMQVYWTPLFGILMGTNEVVYRFEGV